MTTPVAPLYTAFPPGLGQLRVPVSSRDAALAGLALYSSCRRGATLLHRAAWASVRLLGPGALPGRREAWRPMPDAQWEMLRDALRADVGAFDEVAGYRRTDARRGGAALLLLRQGQPAAFVKIRKGGTEIFAAEARATRLAWRAEPATFRVPEPVALGAVGEWAYFVSEPLPPRLHHVAIDPPLPLIVQEIAGALAGMPRPAGLPSHWQPMHGDLTPWNLREMERGRRFLIDWEDAGWGPPDADEVLYRATLAGLRGAPPHCCLAAEAIDYWRFRLARRSGDERDRLLDRAMLRALHDMERAL